MEPETPEGDMQAYVTELQAEVERGRAEADELRREAERAQAGWTARLEASETAERAARAAYTGLLRAQAGLIPELVGGESLAEIEASLEPAREAYRRAAGLTVGAGGSARVGPEREEPGRPGDRAFGLILQGVSSGRGGLSR